MVHSVLSRVQRSDRELDPHPYLVVHDALPPDYYQQLVASFPQVYFPDNPGEPLPNNFGYGRSTVNMLGDPRVNPVWHDFLSYHTSETFFQELVSLWGDIIAELYPNLEENFGRPLEEFSVGIRQTGKKDNPDNHTHQINLDCQAAINTPVTGMSAVRGPHVDSPYKLFAAILYCRLPNDDSIGGELELYQMKARRNRLAPHTAVDYSFIEKQKFPTLNTVPARYIERVEVVPYRANTLVAWLNTPHSIHGVSQRSVCPVQRQYINFLGECYTGQQDGWFRFEKRRESLWQSLRQKLG